jgi:hypothetical protein
MAGNVGKRKRKANPVGRPKKPPGERAKIVSTSVPAAVLPWLASVGDGSASRGMRAVILDGFISQAAGQSGKGQ